MTKSMKIPLMQKKNAEKFHTCFVIQKCAFFSKNVKKFHEYRKMQKNPLMPKIPKMQKIPLMPKIPLMQKNAEKFQKYREVPLMQKNFINVVH
jgi:hypothetical protein